MKEENSRLGSVIGGLIVIGIGVWFLLETMGFNLPGIGQFWPIFPLLGGAAFIAMYLSGEDAGVLFPGVGGLLIGILFFLITLGPLAWEDMAWLWPAFPLIGGLAFLATWLASREPGLLFVGGAATAVGVIGFLFTATGLDGRFLADFWPIILILIGVGVLAQGLLRRQD